MRTGIRASFVCFALVLLGSACAVKNTPRDAASDGYRPVELRHALGFKLWQSVAQPESFRVDIYDPRDTASGVLHRYLLSAVTDSAVTASINIPVDRTALGSTTFVPFFNRLHAASRIAGVSYGDRVADSTLSARLRSGKVVELTAGEQVDLERLIALAPSVFLTNDFGNTDMERLDDLEINSLVITEYLEPHPLGRAEWLLLFGALTGRFDEAQQVFDSIENAYAKVRSGVDTTALRPRVFAGSRYGDFWYAPGGNSYLAAFFRDSGADYVFDDRRWSGNSQLDFEAALGAVADADYWGLILASPERFTLADLRAMDSRYASLRAFRQGRVFVCNTEKSDYFGKAILEPQLVLTDLIRIFHGDTLGEGFRYFRPVTQK